MLVLGTRDSFVYIYTKDTAGFNQKLKLAGHTREVKSVYYSKKFKYLFSAGTDSMVIIWNPFVREYLMKLKSKKF